MHIIKEYNIYNTHSSECLYLFSSLYTTFFFVVIFNYLWGPIFYETRTRVVFGGLCRRHVFGPCQKDRNRRARELRPPIIARVCIHYCVPSRGPHRLHDLDLFGDKNGMQFHFFVFQLTDYIV